MKKALLSLALALLVSASAFALPQPKRETRAVWLTTIGGLDWPHSYARSAASVSRQQAELCLTLGRLQRAGINTILLQTRIRATTIFQSTAASGTEPWDGCLSGIPGTSPGYDALSYAVAECHRRGMECHAWVVAIPVGKWNGAGCRHLRQTTPSMLMKIGDEGYMNPASPLTAPYLARYCADIARRYDIDGIHLDYIRYPEAMRRLPAAAEGRANITRIVREVHDAVRREKPWVVLSCSPIGKHDDTRRYWSHGWNARSRVLQDAKAWLKEGIMDALFPMMYFRGENFYPFAVDWQEGADGRDIAPGLAVYMLNEREGNWPLTDITRELCVIRSLGMGQCYFRSKFLTDDTKGVYRYLLTEHNRYPALPLPRTWLSTARPSAPSGVRLRIVGDTTYVAWGAAHDTSGCDYILYNVYHSLSYPVDTSRPENLLATRVGGQRLSLATRMGGYYAVTAMTRYGIEGEACQMKVLARKP